MLASCTDWKAIFSTNVIFHCNWSPKNDPKRHAATKQGPTTTNLAVCDLEHYLQSESLLACKQRKKTAQQCENTSNFKTTPPLAFQPDYPKYIPDIHQVIAPCLGNNTTPSKTDAPTPPSPFPFEGALSSKRQV